MSDFEQVVESYLPAARQLGLDRAHVERAVRSATRLERRCPSCRLARAQNSAVHVAQFLGRLDIFNRRCADRLPVTSCPHWERLELPAVLEGAPAEETPTYPF